MTDIGLNAANAPEGAAAPEEPAPGAGVPATDEVTGESAEDSAEPGKEETPGEGADNAAEPGTEETSGDGAEDSAAREDGEEPPEENGFERFGLRPEVLRAVKSLGFEMPSPIQDKAIAPILAGRDLIGQAQTGTGKTAAFCLPLLSRISVETRDTQVLIVTPTRELALQVAEACQSFAKYLQGFRVTPIYGGASYDVQLKALKRGAQAVVGTPGRVMDMIERGALVLDRLATLVLDEADEMLQMGFIEDVEWIIRRCPENRQIALFSATMPEPIKRVARQYLRDPAEIRTASRTTAAATVRQRYWVVSGLHKIDALTRLLEVEPYDALLIFTRTKTAAEELAGKLAARGHACEALHGDVPQKMREKLVERFRNGTLDVLIATDVAARGLDVDRITHVVNYDIPYDPESYVHRIGRTGRAGRTGDAILFVSPRERRMLRLIEQTTRQPIEPMTIPTTRDINMHRVAEFKNRMLSALEADDLEPYQKLISEVLTDDAVDPVDLCAALAKMAQGGEPLFLEEKPEPEQKTFGDGYRVRELPARPARRPDGEEPSGGESGDAGPETERRPRKKPSATPLPLRDYPDIVMVRYRLAVGYRDGVKAGQIVGAIANEGDIESRFIGCIDIFDTFSTVDLPEGMPGETMEILKRSRVCGRALEIRRYYGDDEDVNDLRRERAGAADQRRMKKVAGKKAPKKAAGTPAGRKRAAPFRF